ncbi:hypothetical protein BASA50_003836 [Batrachochytrium salamandrivorans]|uniref:Autophagy-related protein n=1 Tax=Batrachochytrium salamandrivorans TaxID=1357716 RepID=A0ABQ8FHM5_9FUNG|nr:hypothetical protein BASA62_010012 [Batrachochytrium salamandrivorans]KAH6579034.1 hypothetical protein BASA60_003429 [Batrachochytrium salamandrivorans]KAH6598221.1 hypothetical protein BASA50_003836 [Batrachochytrium salamandrivorans]KAH9276004.1 hypothetical protein BASA83_001276 [Batrachochytrium salamandrivorans]
MSYRQEYSFDRRAAEAHRILESFPGRVPLIVERGGSWTTKPIPQMEKKKFLCPSDITVGQFQSVIRKRLEIHSEQGLFLTVSNKFLPPSSALLSQIYAEYKDSDGFLYVTYATESVFGR